MNAFEPITPESIIDLRRRLGLNQTAFAVLLNVQQATVSRWESGERFPDGRSVVAIIGLMGSSPDNRLTGCHPNG